jgi:hypothetical protein
MERKGPALPLVAGNGVRMDRNVGGMLVWRVGRPLDAFPFIDRKIAWPGVDPAESVPM